MPQPRNKRVIGVVSRKKEHEVRKASEGERGDEKLNVASCQQNGQLLLFAFFPYQTH
jgi:hypothetical protein